MSGRSLTPWSSLLGGVARSSGRLAREAWRLAVERAGLDGFTFHGLRHSFVAILVAAGCNVREVSEWAGHNSVAFTLLVMAASSRTGRTRPSTGSMP